MTSYLQPAKSGPMPFTGEDICAELGIDPAEFAFTIGGMIATEVIMSRNPVRHETWWVNTGPRFDDEAKRGNCGPSSVGAPFQYQGREFVEVTYEPRDWAVAIIRKNVISRARREDDVHLFQAIREADRAKRSEARADLREQLHASLAEAV